MKLSVIYIRVSSCCGGFFRGFRLTFLRSWEFEASDRPRTLLSLLLEAGFNLWSGMEQRYVRFEKYGFYALLLSIYINEVLVFYFFQRCIDKA